MSVRFFKIFSGVFLAHIFMMSVMWVGFSAPVPKPPARFVYAGVLPSGDMMSSSDDDHWPKVQMADHLTVDHRDASYFNRWIKFRDPTKSSAYDHLGF